MRYGLPYNSGPFHQQLGTVQRTIVRLALPGGKPRPRPGAYDGTLIRGKGERDAQAISSAAYRIAHKWGVSVTLCAQVQQSRFRSVKAPRTGPESCMCDP